MNLNFTARIDNKNADLWNLSKYLGLPDDYDPEDETISNIEIGYTLDIDTGSRNINRTLHYEKPVWNDGIERIATQVRTWLPEIRASLRARLDQRLADLKQPLDPGRLEQEVVLNLQKIDVDEELDRLASHVAEARRVLSLPEAVGRRLDFLMQEFNREANTLGSKSVDARTTQAAVDLKVLIEQLREQVQNLE